MDSIEKTPIWTENDIYNSALVYYDLVKSYNNDYHTLMDLYKGLLQFESEFSLSYGFSRYIDAFREYFFSIKGDKEIVDKNILYLKEDEEKENSTGCIVDCGQIHTALSNQLEKRKDLEKYIEEIKLKYSNLTM